MDIYAEKKYINAKVKKVQKFQNILVKFTYRVQIQL